MWVRFPLNFILRSYSDPGLNYQDTPTPYPIDNGPDPLRVPWNFFPAVNAWYGAKSTDSSNMRIPQPSFALAVQPLYNYQLNRGLLARLRPAPMNRGNFSDKFVPAVDVSGI